MQSNYLKPINVRTNIKTVLDCSMYSKFEYQTINQSITIFVPPRASFPLKLRNTFSERRRVFAEIIFLHFIFQYVAEPFCQS